MKKFLRLILVFLIFVLASALSTVTALACSPDDSNPEHHENIIQTDEEKATCLAGGYYVLECTVCGMRCTYQTDPPMPHSYGPWEIVPGKEPTCTKDGVKRAYCSMCNKWYEMPAPATGHSWYKYYTKEPTCTTAGEYYTYCRNCSARGAPQNLLRITFGLPGSKYSLPAPPRAISNMSATTAARMEEPSRSLPRGTASARGLPRRRPPA